MPGSGRFILSGFYYYLPKKNPNGMESMYITQLDLQLGHLPEYFRQNYSFPSTRILYLKKTLNKNTPQVLRISEHTTLVYSVPPL